MFSVRTARIRDGIATVALVSAMLAGGPAVATLSGSVAGGGTSTCSVEQTPAPVAATQTWSRLLPVPR